MREIRYTITNDNTGASGTNALAAGVSASASGENVVAIGYGARQGATVIGQYGKATGRYALSFGGQQTDTTAFGNSTVAVGMNTASFGTDNVAGAVLDDNGAYTNIVYETNSKGRVVKDTNGNPRELSREKMDARGNLAYLDGSGHTKSVTYTVPGGKNHSYVLLQGTDGNTYIRDYRGNQRR